MNVADIYTYNHTKKKVNGLILFGFILFCMIIIAVYLYFFGRTSIIKGTFFERIILSVWNEITSQTNRGAFFLTFFGGLFFIVIPIEIPIELQFINNPDTGLIFALFMAGLILSYTINYFIGLRFSNLSRSIISTKKFYQIKIWLNKYGKIAVYLANALPFAPSQQISVILGIFRYNRYKFWSLTIAGQLTKVIGLLLVAKFFGKIFIGVN